MYKNIQELYSGNLILGDLLLKDKSVEFAIEVLYGEKLGSIYTEMNSSQFDKQVLKYIPDNYPPPRPAPRLNDNLERLYRPPSSIVATSGPGLRFAWSVYRGPAEQVKFVPAQMKTYTDTRMYGNSAWSPPFTIPEPPADGRWTAEVTFDEPGEYVLRGVASDGSMFSYQNLMVTVTR